MKITMVDNYSSIRTYYNSFIAMQAIVSQFLSILRFNNYFIINRLRQHHDADKVKEIVKNLLEVYKQDLVDQYEALCFVTIEDQHDINFTYETHTNVQAGIINIYDGNEPIESYSKDQVRQVQIVAFYHKVMPFQEIVILVKEKKTPQTKKYHNKNFDQVIQVSPVATTPFKKSPTQRKVIISAHKPQVISQPKTNRKLMIVSQSQQNESNHQPQISERINLYADQPVDEEKILQSIFSGKKQYGRTEERKQLQYKQFEEVRGEFDRETAPPLTPVKFTPRTKSKSSSSKKYQTPRQIMERERQSEFLKKWLHKEPNDKS